MSWEIIIAIGVLVFLQRGFFILIAGRWDLPPRIQQALRFAPAAALSAIILPAILYRDGDYQIALSNPRIIAALLAGVVAYRTRNVIATLVVGMIALWVLQSVVT